MKNKNLKLEPIPHNLVIIAWIMVLGIMSKTVFLIGIIRGSRTTTAHGITSKTAS